MTSIKPIFLITGILSGIAALIFSYFILAQPLFNLSSSKKNEFVTFDTAKYINAKREMTARLLGTNEHQKQVVNILARVEKSTMEVLEKHANNRIVLVKQALVVDDQAEDITDKVLEELGLPTETATVQPQSPTGINTTFSNSDDYLYSQELNKKIQERASELKDEALKNRQEKIDRFKQEEIEQFLP